MFGKKAKRLRQSQKSLCEKDLFTSSNLKEFFKKNFDTSKEYYDSHRRRHFREIEYNITQSNEEEKKYTLSKLKDIFLEGVKKGLGENSNNMVFISFNVYLGKGPKVASPSNQSIQSKMKKALNKTNTNISNMQTILPFKDDMLNSKEQSDEDYTYEDNENTKTKEKNAPNKSPFLNSENFNLFFLCNNSIKAENEIDKEIHIEIEKTKRKIKKYYINDIKIIHLFNFSYLSNDSNNDDEMKCIINKITDVNMKICQNEIKLPQLKEEYNELTEKINKYLLDIKRNDTQRKKAQEYLHSLKGNLRVYCRIRPSTQPEKSFISFPEIITPLTQSATLASLTHAHHSSQVLTTIETRINSNITVYNFDRIFPQNSTQEDIFSEVKQFVQSALDGENICIFAYGATGSGKTFTMQGYSNLTTSSDEIVNERSGIFPRCAEFIFKEKNRVKIQNQDISIQLAAIEIYNENIYDLLQSGKNTKGNMRTPLTIYCANNEVNIPNLKWVEIENEKDIIKYTNKASESRRCDSTAFNSTSSRSHAIFQIKLTNAFYKRTSMINIIDLAGSERNQLPSFSKLNKEEIDNLKKIQNEANFINKSLSALGRIINLIGDKKNANKISIPYRESKLTIVLQEYLKPNAKTVMIVNIACEPKNFNYTKESLNFAANAMVSC